MEEIDQNQTSHNQPALLPKLNNDPLALILSIVAIVLCCGLIGLIINAITFSMSKKEIANYEANVGAYSEASYNNMKLTKTISIVGLVLNVLGTIFTIVYFGAIMAMIAGGNM